MPRNVKRRDVLKGAGAAGATVAFAGCLGGGNGNGSRALKQGVLLPLSGDLANLGQPIRDGAILPAAELEGETDYTIDISEEDTETNPQAGISGADALIDAGYPAVTGPASSGVNLQVTQQSLIPNSTVGCSPSSTAPAVTTLEDDDYIYRTCPSDALQGQVIAQVGAEELGNSDAATMYVNNDYGQALSQSFADTFESEYDGEVKQQVSFEQQQSSYTSQLESALNDSPSLLVVIGYPESGNQLFRDYYSDFDSGEDIVVTDGLIDNELPDNVDNDMANVTGTAPKSSGPGRETFDELYENEYDRAPGVFNAQAYDGTAICLLANVYAGENDGTGVRDNMRRAANPEGEEFGPGELAEAIEAADAGDDINYQGASSATNFDDNGDMVAVSYGIYEVQDRDFTEVDSVAFGQ
ncbi:ABC transporter substrate-binding protein [Natronomonas halophila]|uniref:ABC transporter substrate-binding protein n=1 Tax=Natronomonas halophila TaxID=2747817 RepID=UPI0015B54548|nr:ABC transporter substrate-binding protein [Natronomonas halophila]QLD86965.1 ABC transporter substrate-binding protein [Natronomonas halophila]